MTMLYAYRYDDDMDYTVAREKGVPVTGWLHAYGGPPWRVVVAAHTDLIRIPKTTVMEYGGDEPTIPYTDAWPMLSTEVRD
jgi:hypothetical protein